MVLLGARLLPGIRTPIFIMAGVLRVPFGRFLLADAIYAIPMVNVLFWLSYMLTDQVLAIFNQINAYRPLVISHLLAGIVGPLLYKYVFARHVSTGEPPHVPKIIAKPAGAIGHAVESAVEKVTGRHQLADGNGEKTESGNGGGRVNGDDAVIHNGQRQRTASRMTTSRAFRPSADGASRHTSPFRTRTGPVPPVR